MANDVFMEPVTGIERISKQRWKLVRFSYILEVFYFKLFDTEVYNLRHSGRSVYPVHETIMLRCLPCDLCAQGQVVIAHEKRSRSGACITHLFLRSPPPSTSNHNTMTAYDHWDPDIRIARTTRRPYCCSIN